MSIAEKRLRAAMPLVALVGTVMLLCAGCRSMSFVERCRAYSSGRTELPGRRAYEPFTTRRLMRLIRYGTLDEWKDALKDEDPKVRTFGVLAIGLGDDPSLLPLLRDSLEDEAPAFNIQRPSLPRGMHVRYEPQRLRTVADYARSVVGEWMYGNGDVTAEEFDTFWNGVEDPEKLVAVWNCRFSRSERKAWPTYTKARRRARKRLESGGKRPIPEEIQAEAAYAIVEEVIPVRQRLEKEQPPRVRMLVALTVRSRVLRKYLWSYSERKALVRENLSREDAVACLRHEKVFDDPSIVPGGSEYVHFCAAILDNMDWKAEDARLLLEMEADELKRKDNAVIIPNWVLAASRAQDSRERSLAILKDVLARAEGDYKVRVWYSLAMEVWDVAGLDEADYLIDQFYKESTGADIQDSGLYLISSIAKSGDDVKVLLGKLIRDDRLLTISPTELHRVIVLCTQLTGERIVPVNDLSFPDHPLGMGAFATKEGIEQAKAEYPAETKVVLDKVASWRKQLTEYADKHEW